MFAIKASKYKISFYSMEVSLYDDKIAIFPYNAQLIYSQNLHTDNDPYNYVTGYNS